MVKLSKKSRKVYSKLIQEKLLASGLKDESIMNVAKIERYVDGKGVPLVFDQAKTDPRTGMPVIRPLEKGEKLARNGEEGLQQVEVPKMTASNPVRNITKRILASGLEAVEAFLKTPVVQQKTEAQAETSAT